MRTPRSSLSISSTATCTPRHGTTPVSPPIKRAETTATSRRPGSANGPWTRVAADQARGNYANVEASELLERALTAARRCTDIDAVEMATVAEQLGDVRERMGVYDRARDAYHDARMLRADDALYDAHLCWKQ